MQKKQPNKIKLKGTTELKVDVNGDSKNPISRTITCLLIEPDKLNVPEESLFVVKDSMTVLVKQYLANPSSSGPTYIPY